MCPAVRDDGLIAAEIHSPRPTWPSRGVLWALALLALLPFAIHWRLILANAVDQRHMCCDFGAYHYPAYLEGREWLRSGVFPHWNPYGNLGGTHLPSDPSLGFFYPPNWIVYALGALSSSDSFYLRAIYVFIVLHVALGGIATALLARSLAGLRWSYALFAGLLFVSSGFINAHTIGPAHTIAFSLAPAILLTWHRFLHDDRLLWFTATTILLGLALVGGYQFVPLYVTIPTMLVLTAFRHWPFRSSWKEPVRHLALLGVSVFLAVGIFFVQLFPALFAYRESYRPSAISVEWNSQYRLDFTLLYQLVMPNLYSAIGRPHTLSYWGYYLGLLPPTLLFLAFLRPRLRTRAVLGSGVIASVAFVIALGHQTLVQQLMYLVVPGIGVWRSISYYFLLVVLFGAIAASGLLQSLSEDPQERSALLGPLRKVLAWWIIGAGAIALLLWTFHALVLGIATQAYETIRGLEPGHPLAQPGVYFESGKRALGVISRILANWGMFGFLLTVTLVGLILFLEHPNRKRLALLGLIVVMDVSAQLDRSPLLSAVESPAALYQPNHLTSRLSALRGDQIVRFIFDDALPYRDYAANRGFFAQTAYSPFSPPYGRELLALMISRAGLDAFNFKFLVIRQPLAALKPPWRLRDMILLRQEPTEERVWIYENPNTMPRAFLVDAIVGVPGADPANQVTALRNIDPKSTAVVFENDLSPSTRSPPLKRSALSRGHVRIGRYERANVQMGVETDGPGFVFMSDAYHPWWRLYVNGKEAKLLRTDGHFRGFFVPAGASRVEMRFAMGGFWLGAGVSLASLLVTLLIPLWSKLSLVPIRPAK